MINFHKFSFLDVKKLMQVFDEKNYFSTFYDPLWMFVWSDYYKFQIAYQNDFVFIKFMMPKIGMCYYPPLMHHHPLRSHRPDASFRSGNRPNGRTSCRGT